MKTNNNYKIKKDPWWFLSELPQRAGRYIVIDTETTGFSSQYNNIIEIAAIEVLKGRLTGAQYHAYIKPRNPIDPKAQEVHKLPNNFFQEYFTDVYQSDKITMENFLKFVGNSIIFAHNASFDYQFINNELKYWKLPLINRGRFRCTMRIFKDLFNKVDPRCKTYSSLHRCCEYFKLRSPGYYYHTAIFDSLMTARLLCKIWDYVENRKNIENINSEISYTIDPNLNIGAKNNNNDLFNNFPIADNNIFKPNDDPQQRNSNHMNIARTNDALFFPQSSHQNTGQDCLMSIDNEKEEIPYDNPEEDNNENDILSDEYDSELLLIQNNECFIKEYMKEQVNEEHNKMQYGHKSNTCNQENEINDALIFPLEHGPAMAGTIQKNEVVPTASQTPNKYQDLMIKYVNSINKANGLKSPMNEELLQIKMEDIEEYFKGEI